MTLPSPIVAGSWSRIRLSWLLVASLLLPVGSALASNLYQGVSTNSLFWPGGTIPYQFDTNITAVQQSVYLAGLREWELAANVHFVPRTNQSQYVRLRFGYQQGTNTFVLGTPPVMTVDTLARSQVGHEAGHLLGLQHEHVRTDRDSFITVNFSNLQTNGAGEQDSGIVSLYLIDTNSTPYGAYDFESVMHYGRTLFSIDPDTLDVMVPKPAYLRKYYYRIGNIALSPGDRAGAAYLYGPPATALTNVVTNTGDVGFGTLRAAIYYANDHPGTTIRFNIPVSDSGYSNGVYTIYLSGELPAIEADGTVIDASTQPGFVNKPIVAISGSKLIPELAYANSLFVSGLHGYAANCVFRGLAINHFTDCGMFLQYAFALSNRVEGCYLGLAPDGTNSAGATYEGINMQLGASYNTIGGIFATQRNVICGNGDNGVDIMDTNSISNVVVGNYIGTDASGTRAIPNGNSGVLVWGGAGPVTVGGTNAGARNVLSGNAYHGVAFVGTSNSVILGNYIGTDATGTFAISNGLDGIVLYGGAHDSTIGGTNSGARNVISGNGINGIALDGVSNIVVQGNFIGTDASGTNRVPNPSSGISAFDGTRALTIGGTNAGARNVISGNGGGVTLDGVIGCAVMGNFIGTDANGGVIVSNGGFGINIVNGTQNSVVGGANATARNIVSGNLTQGILVQGSGTANISLLGNFVGLDVTGSNGLPNGVGIGVYGDVSNLSIGGTNAAARNYVAASLGSGIEIGNGAMPGSVVQGNYVGVATNGVTPRGNGGYGVYLFTGPSGIYVGGTAPGAGNLVSACGSDAIVLSGSATRSNLVQGNLVGTTKSGTAAIGNQGGALSIYGGASFNIIGGATAASRNVFSASLNGFGIFVGDVGTSNNVIQGNYIGTDINGSAPIPNNGSGVFIGSGASSNLLGGAVTGAGNVISANLGDGVQLIGAGTSRNLVQGNFVGTDKTGTQRLGNRDSALTLSSGPTFNTIGGTSAAARNILSASTNYDGVFIYAATNNTIQGNYIGTDITGLLGFTNGAEGLTLFGGSQNNLIGGASVGAGNVIAASGARGIFLADPGTSGNFVQGNFIGVGTNGTTPLGNALEGVLIDNAAQNNVIGLAPDGSGGGNTIAFNRQAGVMLFDAATTGNTVRGNVLSANARLGIDLAGGSEDSFGVTANHPGGAVSGPNNLQNYPVLAPAAAYPNGVVLAGTLNSSASRQYAIDLYRNATPDPSGHGQGQVYLGSTILMTDGLGNGGFSLLSASNVPNVTYAATATDLVTGDTSEFSANVTPTNAPPQFFGPPTKGPGGFSFSVLLQTNLSYHLQATTNVGAHPIIWSNVTSFVANVSPLQLTDPAATNTPARFYRVVSP